MQLARLATLLAALALGACASVPPARKVVDARFALPDLEGRTVSSEDFAGKVLLVDTWATWCKPCEASLPFYSELALRYREQGLEVVAISVDTDEKTLRDYLARWPGLPLRVLRDPAGSFPARIDIPTMPTLVVVGRDQAVRFLHAGFVEEDRARIEEEVKAALSARTSSVSM